MVCFTVNKHYCTLLPQCVSLQYSYVHLGSVNESENKVYKVG